MNTYLRDVFPELPRQLEVASQNKIAEKFRLANFLDLIKKGLTPIEYFQGRSYYVDPMRSHHSVNYIQTHKQYLFPTQTSNRRKISTANIPADQLSHLPP